MLIAVLIVAVVGAYITFRVVEPPAGTEDASCGPPWPDSRNAGGHPLTLKLDPFSLRRSSPRLPCRFAPRGASDNTPAASRSGHAPRDALTARIAPEI
jgi:hypothetical protein